MEQGTIKGVFSSDKDGVEYITRNGNPFLKVMVVVGDDAYYDSFFLTPKAHWKFESLFQACGRVAPSFDEFKFADVESLIGNNVLVRVGKDKGGYDNINLYKPVTNSTPKIVDPQPEKESQFDDDPDLSEDVPF